MWCRTSSPTWCRFGFRLPFLLVVVLGCAFALCSTDLPYRSLSDASLSQGLLKASSSLSNHRRSLLQSGPAPAPQTSVAQYTNCLQLDEESEYRIFWTLEDDNTARIALEAKGPATANQYMGFGISKNSAVSDMIGSDAVIAGMYGTGQAGCFAYDYILGGKSPCSATTRLGVCQDSVLGDAGGNLVTSCMQGAVGTDKVVRVEFTKTLKAENNRTDLNWPVETEVAGVWALGRLSGGSAAQPGLTQHSSESGRDFKINFGATANSPTCKSLLADFAPGPAPATESPEASPTPAPTTAPAPPSNAAAVCSLQLSLGGLTSRTFAFCSPLQVGRRRMTMRWSLSPAEGGSGTVLDASLEAEHTGWIAVAVPSTPGDMVGAEAVIAQTCSGATCSTGATVKDYTLADRDKAAFTSPGKLGFSKMEAAAANGRMAMAFSVRLSDSQAQLAEKPTDFLFAYGDVTGVSIQQHGANTRASAQVNLVSGTGARVTGGINPNLIKAHGWLMALSFGFLIPLGVVIARNLKLELEHSWFNLHRGIQSLGLLLGLAGFGLGLYCGHHSLTEMQLHRWLGIVAVALMTLNVLIAVALRPKKEHSARRYWEAAHFWIGRTALLIAIANIYVGMDHYRENYQPSHMTAFIIVYSAVLALLVGLSVAKSVRDSTRGGRRAGSGMERMEEKGAGGAGAGGLDQEMVPHYKQGKDGVLKGSSRNVPLFGGR